MQVLPWDAIVYCKSLMEYGPVQEELKKKNLSQNRLKIVEWKWLGVMESESYGVATISRLLKL